METTIPRRRRVTAFRRAGWLGVVLLASLAVAGPGAAGAAATVVVPGTTTPGAFTAATACGTTPLDVELIIDTSGSMGSTQYLSGGHTRLYWAQQAATQLVNQLNLPANGGVGAGGLHKVGLTYFSGTTGDTSITLISASSASQIDSAINGLTANGNTPFLLGMTTGQADMAKVASDGSKHIYVFLSDGSPNPANTQTPSSGQISTFQGTADVVWSVAIGQGGTGVNGVNLPLMQSLANPGGDFAHATDANTLPSIFRTIFNTIACTPGFSITKGVSLSESGPFLPSVTTTDNTPVYYEVVVTNTGNVALDNVTLTDDHTTLSDVCTIPTTLAAGDSITCDYSSTAADGTTKNTATAGATGLDSQVASATVTASSPSCEESGTCPTTPPTSPPTSPPCTAANNCYFNTPSPSPSVSPSPSASPSPSPSPSPTPTSAVEAATSKPHITPPPTSSLGGTTGGPSNGIWLVLLVLAGLLGSILLLTPVPARARRKR